MAPPDTSTIQTFGNFSGLFSISSILAEFKMAGEAPNPFPKGQQPPEELLEPILFPKHQGRVKAFTFGLTLGKLQALILFHF